MSKFDYSIFCGGYDDLAVSKEKYTKEQAIEIAKSELLPNRNKPYELAIGSGYVRHRAGINEDGNPQVGWWLEYDERSRSCPAWIFHIGRRPFGSWENDYDHVRVEPGGEA